MREIKFRAWDGTKMYFWGFTEYGFDGPPSNRNGSFMSMVQMQYTGMKDKNGREIYEGDILQLDKTARRYFRRVVVFDEGAFGYRDLTETFQVLRNVKATWGVIGNIWENPELVKPNKNEKAPQAQ